MAQRLEASRTSALKHTSGACTCPQHLNWQLDRQHLALLGEVIQKNYAKANSNGFHSSGYPACTAAHRPRAWAGHGLQGTPQSTRRNVERVQPKARLLYQRCWQRGLSSVAGPGIFFPGQNTLLALPSLQPPSASNETTGSRDSRATLTLLHPWACKLLLSRGWLHR